MSAAAIKAGKAWVELALKDKTDAGLANVKRKFMRWGVSLAAVGGAIQAAAGGILGALTGAAKIFGDTGSEIYDMSRATGVGAEQLSALGYAASQSGASMADVATAFKSLGKFAANVSAGSESATQALAQLGISAQDFMNATPYGRLLLVADGLKGIADEGLRSALAVAVLGRGAQSLGSLLRDGAAGVTALVDEAQRLGLVVSQAEADKADALGDAWAAVGAQFKQVAFVAGAALADSLTSIAQVVQTALAGVIEFIRNNQGLVKGLAVAAAVVGAFGAALTVVGGTLAGAGLALAALPAVMAGIGTALAAIFSPVGLVIGAIAAVGAALVAGAAYWLGWTESGRAAVKSVMDFLSPLFSFVKEVFGGIWNAIAMGNWGQAGQIMWAALKVAFEAGKLSLMQVWFDVKEAALGFFDSMMATAQLAVAYVANLFSGFFQGFGDAFDSVKQFVADYWHFFSENATAAFEAISGIMKAFFAAFSVGMSEVRKGLSESSDAANLPTGNRPQMSGVFDPDAILKSAQGDLAKRAEELLAGNAQKKADREAVAGKSLAAQEEKLAAAAGDLGKLLAEAAAARKSAATIKTPDNVANFAADQAANPSIAMSGGAAAGTFNAAIAGMLGSSAPSIADKQLAETKSTNKLLERVVDNTDNLTLEDAE